MKKPGQPRPKKPAGSPLHPHASGQWAAKIDGVRRYFGQWSDYAGALERYHDYRHSMALKRAPRRHVGESIDVEELCDRFLAHHHTRAESHQITLRSFRDMMSAINRFKSALGAVHVPVSALAPEDFVKFRQGLAKLSTHAINRNITLVRQLFRWGYNEGLIEMPRFGAGLARAPKEAERRAGVRKDLEHGKAILEPKEVRHLIETAKPVLKAMMLLGINCGFGQTDVAELSANVIDWKDGWIDYARIKTGIPRRCPLWPITIEALKAAIKLRPDPANPDHDHLVFLTVNGLPYVREHAERVQGTIQGVSVTDNVSMLFDRHIRKHKLHRPRLGFYCLRRTHRTITEECGDDRACDFIMGHQSPGMGGRYAKTIFDPRLRKLTDHVHLKVFGVKPVKPGRKPSHEAPAAAAEPELPTLPGTDQRPGE